LLHPLPKQSHENVGKEDGCIRVSKPLETLSNIINKAAGPVCSDSFGNMKLHQSPQPTDDNPSQTAPMKTVSTQVSVHDIVFCHEYDDADEVRKLMKARGLNMMPVVDADRRLIGVFKEPEEG
jgi:hypothetical protein